MMNGAPMPMKAGQGMPAEEGKAPASQGGAMQLVSGIQSDMMSLMDMMDRSSATTPEDKQELAKIIAAYTNFVKTNLAGAPGQKPEGAEAPEPSGPASMEAGGNPNARPM